MYNGVYKYSSNFQIDIVCGTESLSLKGGISSPHYINYPKLIGPVPYTRYEIDEPPNELFESTKPVDCPVSKIQYQSAGSVYIAFNSPGNPWLSSYPSKASLDFSQQIPFQETVTILAETDGGINLTLDIIVTVCGHETFTLLNLDPHEKQIVLQKDQAHEIFVNQTWFFNDPVASVANSRDFCIQPDIVEVNSYGLK